MSLLKTVLERLSKEEIIAFVLWCRDHNYKADTVAYSLWRRAIR